MIILVEALRAVSKDRFEEVLLAVIRQFGIWSQCIRTNGSRLCIAKAVAET